MAEMLSILLALGTLSEKRPSRSVAVPVFVPTTVTVAPMIGSLSLACTTVPVIETCANAAAQSIKTLASSKENLFIRFLV